MKFRCVLFFVSLSIILTTALANATAVAPLAFDFESGAQGWISGKEEASLSLTESGSAAILSFENSESATLQLSNALDLASYRSLRFRIKLPDLPAPMHVSLYLIGARDTWYQTWRPIRLPKGTWQEVQVDLRPGTGELAPLGHSKPWGPYAARGIMEMGIQVFADRPLDAHALLDDVEFIPYDDQSSRMDVFNYEISSDRVGQFQKFEITFELSRFWENPFDPDQVEILAQFNAPDGSKFLVPGFFYQGYERSLDEGMERLVPVGSPKWKVRFSPRLLGKYDFQLYVCDHDAGDIFDITKGEFLCFDSGESGFVRVSSDPRYFEFEDGAFFYPIGHNIPATYNEKGAELLGMQVDKYKYQGTFAYDRYLEGMSAAGENFGRIWLGAWSFGLEWSHDYHPAYEGLGRYNQENAWRLDYVVGKADRLGVLLQVALTTFGHWSTTAGEGDWHSSPYNSANGGILTEPVEFWTNQPSQEMYRKMLRYVMARWGYSSNITAWELSNEIDLVSGYGKVVKEVRDWHLRCIDTIRTFDPNPHMTTTNFANYSRDPAILSLPQISYSSTNHYRTNIVSEMRDKVFPLKSEYGKPAIMTECGQDFRGTTPESSTSYLHIGLWSSYMIPFAGSGMPWWWDFIDEYDHYSMFTPLVQFARGEDKRHRELNTRDAAVLGEDNQPIASLPALALQNDQSGYFWIYESGLERSEADELFTPEARSNVTIQISGLKDGAYWIEFWDTWKGGMVLGLTSDAKDGTLRVPVPAFISDIAGKFKLEEPVSVENLSEVEQE